MSAIRLITADADFYSPDITGTYLVKEKSTYIIPEPKGKYLIVGFTQHVDSKLKKINPLALTAVENDVGVVYICDKLPSNPIVHTNIIYVVVSWAWLIHTLFINPLKFKGCFSCSKLAKIAKAFSSFTKYKIPVINSLSDVKDMTRDHEKSTSNLLFEITGGVGDYLLCTPSFKTLSEQGYKINILGEKHREPVFKNLPYINNYFYHRSSIKVTDYDRLYHLHFGQILNDYRLDFNKQNRIYSVANVCSLWDWQLTRKIPEIIVTEDETKLFKESYGKFKNKIFIGIDSARRDTRMRSEKAQELINFLVDNGFTVFTSSLRKLEVTNCINLSEKLGIRDLFALISIMDCIFTVDSSFLHIAGAFSLPGVALMNYFKPEWRTSTYKNLSVFTPKVNCYPCVSGMFVEDKLKQCHRQSCFSFFNWSAIYEELLRLKNND